MKIKALKNFCGKITMSVGDIRECSDEDTLADLIRAGYVESVEEKASESADTAAEKKTAAAKTAKRSVKKDESK